MDYLVGRGIADITGEPAECGMLGYGKMGQRTAGIHLRLRSRAFVLADPSTDRRVLLVVNEMPLMFDSVHREVLRRLGERHGQLYTEQNVMLTVTHTHCGPGGYCDYPIYNSGAPDFHGRTFAAIVDGIIEAVDHAHADVAPATLTLAHGELHDASANRSLAAFDRNPQQDKDFFPDGIDPQTTLLRIERDGAVVGAINWFATHGTSMTNENRLISSDNKGYAAYHWERVVEGVDYLADTQPDFIAAFAQTNTGDMSPNLNHRPGSGPTEDEFDNTRIIGLRQQDAASKLLADKGSPIHGEIDHRLVYVDMSRFEVRPEFTGDGQNHRTGYPSVGAAALAGTREGPAFKGFRIGPAKTPILYGLSQRVIYPLASKLRDAQAPKTLTPVGGLLGKVFPTTQTRVPVQLLRLGQCYLIGIPGEVTITAGLRLRRQVAKLVGADVRNVLVAGYSNAYFHYLTTPQEYTAQCYEGGSTLYGRWQLPALLQVVSELATAMRDGEPINPGQPPKDRSAKRKHDKRRVPVDGVHDGQAFGHVRHHPSDSEPGYQAIAVFAGAYPNNNIRRGATFLEVQREQDGEWRTVANDSDWSTKFHWTRVGANGSQVVITWDIPVDTAAGRYRLRYHGDTQTAAFTGTTKPFEVRTSQV